MKENNKILNEVFLNRMKNDLSSDDYNSYINSLSELEKHGFTINLDKLSRSSIDLECIIKKFNAKVIYKNDHFAYLIYDKENLEKNSVFPGRDPLHHVGLYYIQEPSASKVLYDVKIKKSDCVLDLCASPGGKSVEILYSLDKNVGGFIISNEINFDRAKILSSNIERMGFDNAIVTCNEPKELSNKFCEFFDKVIVDAPCSGEGMFRKSEEARRQWSESLVKSCAKIQRELIDEAYKMLKGGGLFIYSTCTFSKDEDEDNVDYLLEKYKDMKLMHIEKIYPNNSIGEGQFFAIIKKEENGQLYNNHYPNIKELKGLNVIRYGLELFEEHNGRREPTHASTHNDNVNFENIVDLNDEEIMQYLHGDVIRRSNLKNGWCKISYKGLGVGLGKITNNVIKNHYPKGLRNMKDV